MEEFKIKEQRNMQAKNLTSNTLIYKYGTATCPYPSSYASFLGFITRHVYIQGLQAGSRQDIYGNFWVNLKYIRQWKLSWRTPLSYADTQLYLQPPSQSPSQPPNKLCIFPISGQFTWAQWGKDTFWVYELDFSFTFRLTKADTWNEISFTSESCNLHINIM